MIPVRNIYYMMAYAFQALRKMDISRVEPESFDNALELYAEILVKAVNVQVKQGLRRDYIPVTETMPSVKGKIDVSGSIKTQSILRRRLVCTYDDYSVDTRLNRIIRTTLMYLLKSDIRLSQKKEIRKLLVYFEGVEEIDVRSIDWKHRYERNEQSYELIINVCHMVLKGLLQTESDGSYRLREYMDEQGENALYEKFILEYYRRHYPQLNAQPSLIYWQLDGEGDELLPVMRTDITLRKGNTVLIIDAKYYEHNTQVYQGRHSIHSDNLYQIFSYVKNKDYELRDKEHKVSGMLLYAGTDDEIQPSSRYEMSGNTIEVRTLDLNREFAAIAQQLDGIIEKYYPGTEKAA